MEKVSVVIPMYNAERYIRQCIRSVLSQTYQDLEVLIVDDGSTDRSLDICQAAGQADPRIRCFTTEHKGVSAARNRALDEATGTYLFFLDSDDMIHPHLIGGLMDQAEASQADLAFCKCLRVPAKDMEKKKYDLGKEDIRDKWVIGKKRLAEEWFHITYEKELSCIGGKLIRRECLGALRFDEKLSNGEDTFFLYQLCRNIRMAYLDMDWYYYRRHSESITSGNVKKRDFKVFSRIRNNELQKGRYGWVMEWEYRFVWILLSEYLDVKIRKEKEESRYIKRRIQTEMQHPVYHMFPAGRKLFFSVLYYGCSYLSFFRIVWRMKQKICQSVRQNC